MTWCSSASTTPDAVRQAIEAGVGADRRSVDRGEAGDAAIAASSAPLEVTGVVQTISSGSWMKGGLTPGLQIRQGHRRSCWILGKLRRAAVPAYRADRAGDAASARDRSGAQKFVAIKSRYTGAPIWGRSLGRSWSAPVCTSDYGQMTFRKVLRLLLDPDWGGITRHRRSWGRCVEALPCAACVITGDEITLDEVERVAI